MRALLLVLISSLALAQAEPAPESYRPPRRPGMPQPEEPASRKEQASLPRWHIAVAPHLDFLVGDPPKGLPLIGYGGGVQLTRALVPLGGRARFGVGGDFAYDRFPHEGEFVAHATFAAVAVLDAIVGRVRPWVAIGGGFSVANFESPPAAVSTKAVSVVGVAGLIKLSAGFGVEVYEGFELGLRGDYDATLSGQQVAGKNVWQPGFLSLALDLGFRF
jgi:hypothetical protein